MKTWTRVALASACCAVFAAAPACSDVVPIGDSDGSIDVTGIDVDGFVNPDADKKDTPKIDINFDVDPDAPKFGEPGYPCEDNSQCNSGWCVASPNGGKICTNTCTDNSSCWAGWFCNEVTAPGGDLTYICTSPDAYLCRLCDTDADCNTPGGQQNGVCLQTGHFSLCTRLCSAERPCKEQFDCTNIELEGGASVDVCTADDVNVCSCTEQFVSTGISATCTKDNEFGTCTGTIACTEVGPFPDCDAPDAAAEVCDGVDNDCNGKTDDDAQGCTTWYLDTDGDNYGQGMGQCLCDKPAEGNWITQGGDCNELITSVNPGAQEACNGIDDDCDGETDEEGAGGCITQYIDNDGDNYGVDGVTACFCAGAEGWAPAAGDCDDANSLVNPGATEACNGYDDNCNDATDETDATGCSPFFLDSDGDGFGLSDKVKCLCGPTGAYLTNKPGDCNDADKKVNPNAPELCNGADDNCNNETDEGDAGTLCPAVAHGSAACQGGTCALVSCESGWSDADDDPLNGCECSAGTLEAPGSPGQTCQSPQTLGNLSDAGSEVEVTDNISPEGDVDWYSFLAVDGADPNGCDTFNVAVEFVHNPSEQFVFDVYKGGCAGGNEQCVQSTEFSASTNFLQMAGGEPLGECPCVQSPANPEVSPTSDGVQICTDQSSQYLVKVYRKPGLPESCAAYTLKISNGM